MSKTKIVVIQLKEIIYTALFVGLGILLILLLVFMFMPKKDKSTSLGSEPIYTPGVYTSMMKLNDASVNLEVVVDDNHINSVSIVNVDESVATMYPLLEPSLEQIAKQLYKDVNINEIKLADDSKYTQAVLIDAIKSTLAKAAVTTDESKK